MDKLFQKLITTRTFWTSLAGMVMAGFGVWAGKVIFLAPAGDTKAVAYAGAITAFSAAISAFLGNLGSIFAREGSMEAAREVAVQTGIITPDQKADAEGKPPPEGEAAEE